MTHRLEVSLPVDATAPALARRALAQALPLPPSLLDDARLLVSELVANAVNHAGLSPRDRVRLTAHATAYRLRLEVADGGPGFAPPPALPPPVEAAGGRGILMVRHMSSRWGVGRDGRLRVVWFELRRSPRLGPAAPVQPAIGLRRADRRPAVATCAPVR